MFFLIQNDFFLLLEVKLKHNKKLLMGSGNPDTRRQLTCPAPS